MTSSPLAYARRTDKLQLMAERAMAVLDSIGDAVLSTDLAGHVIYLNRIAEHMTATKRLTIADLKTISGLGRRQVIPLLEAFDREGFTKREGDDRVPGPAFAKASG